LFLLNRFLCTFCLTLALFNLQAHGEISLTDDPIDSAGRDYNLLIGELRLNLGTGATFRWDSNFNRSNSNEEASFSIIPTMFIDAYWPISPYLQFSTGTSIGYEYYLEGESNAEGGPVVGGLDENAASRFDVDLSLSNDAIITAANSFSANIASASIQNDAGQREDQPFRRFVSVSSLQYAQRITPQTRISFDYSFSDTFTRSATANNDEGSNTAINDSFDSQTHSVFGEIGSQINDSIILSLIGNVSDTQYSVELRNDNRQYRIGPRITYISDSGLTSSVQIAFDQLDFDTTNSPAAQDNQSTTLNFESSVSFLQRNFLSHRFSLGYLQEPSLATTANPVASGDAIPVNFQERTTFAYNLSYPLTEQLDVRLLYRLERIKESDEGNQYSRQEISVGLPFQLNTRTSVSARYTYSKVSGSEFTEFNYDQHLVEITFRLNL
jgi:hypothetical protein